jgi:hypothetical protein
MKYKQIIIFIAILVSNQSNGQVNRYKGIENVINIMNPYWSNYKDAIKIKHISAIEKSIARSIGNYSLIEYCFALDELLARLENNPEAQSKWLSYMDSLVLLSYGNDARAGIIPLESQFFIATLKRNETDLSKNFPNSFTFLIKNTPQMYEYGYKASDYESILKEKAFSEVKGEGIVFDLLLLEDVFLLNVIENNSELTKRYNTWLTYKIPDRSFAFEYSDDRAGEILQRKYL